MVNHTTMIFSMVQPGGRHYSDRLCSDRRYSDNPQSGWPSTSLARLAHVEIVEIGTKLKWDAFGCIESTALMEALRWLRGAEPGKGIPVGLGCPPPEMLQRTSTQLYCRWTARRPIQLQSATQRSDCAWTVGIASVGTESVGIVWCTRFNHMVNHG